MKEAREKMREEDVREGDIVELDYIAEFTKERINEGKALLLWKGNSNQPLVRKLDTKTTVWTSYDHIVRVIDHIDIESYMDEALRKADMFDYKNLSEEDQKKLIRNGYSQADVEQIDRSIETTEYRLFEKDAFEKDADICTKKGRKISAKKARSLLGTEEFLSGIGRSTFHCDALRDLPDGRMILFDSSKQFK